MIVEGKVVTRAALVRNEKVVTCTLNVVGRKIGVPALHVHIQSFYDLIHTPIDGHLFASCERGT